MPARAVPSLLQVVVYHGPDRNRSRSWLSQQDVVITTYATLAADVGLRGGAGLCGVQWLRVVLDEAHTIRNSNTQQAKVGAGGGVFCSFVMCFVWGGGSTLNLNPIT